MIGVGDYVECIQDDYDYSEFPDEVFEGYSDPLAIGSLYLVTAIGCFDDQFGGEYFKLQGMLDDEGEPAPYPIEWFKPVYKRDETLKEKLLEGLLIPTLAYT